MERRPLKPTTSKQVKLTNGFCNKVPFTDAGQRVYRDVALPGFLMQVGTQSKTFFAEREIKGTGITRRVKIGRHGVITADEARDEARDLIHEMEKGNDPLDQQKKKVADSANTLAVVWKEFKADRESFLKPSTKKCYQYVMDGPLRKLIDRPVSKISKQEVLTFHRKVGKESGPAYANLACRVLSTVMSFAETKEWVESNPVSILRKAKWFPVGPRTDVIPAEKLPKWFNAVDAVRDAKDDDGKPVMGAAVGADYLELVLLTGLRRNEAARLTWDAVDFDKRTLTITDTKNSDPLTLPLTDHLVTLLRRRQEAAGDSQWVFPSPSPKGKGRNVPLAEPRFIAEMVTARCKIKFTIHDLRRTFITVAARQVPHAVLKSLVNHRAKKKNDVTLDYVRLNTEDLRPDVEKLTGYFLTLKAAGQGMKLVPAAQGA